MFPTTTATTTTATITTATTTTAATAATAATTAATATEPYTLNLCETQSPTEYDYYYCAVQVVDRSSLLP